MKNKIKKVLVLILLTVVAIFSSSGCAALYRYQWKHVYDAYANEKDRYVYYSLKATIIDFNKFNENKTAYFNVSMDEKDFLERYKTDPKVNIRLVEYRSQFYYFVEETIEDLEQSGFYADINENTVITFIVNDFIGWDGWDYPVFAVEMNGKTYLDFETGYENIINYVKARIKNP